MGIVRIMKRGGDEYHEYKKALKMAKKAIAKICELTDDMEEEYSYDERDEYDDEREVRVVKRYR